MNMNLNFYICLVIAWIIVIYETTVIRMEISKLQKDIEQRLGKCKVINVNCIGIDGVNGETVEEFLQRLNSQMSENSNNGVYIDSSK